MTEKILIIYPVRYDDYRAAVIANAYRIVHPQTEGESIAAVTAIQRCDDLVAGLTFAEISKEAYADVAACAEERSNVDRFVNVYNECEVIAIREHHGKLSYQAAVETGAAVYTICDYAELYYPRLMDIYQSAVQTVHAVGADPLMLFAKVFDAESGKTHICQLKPLLHALEKRTHTEISDA